MPSEIKCSFVVIIIRVWTMQEINAEMLISAENLRIPRNDGHAYTLTCKYSL